jgi:hypothetical protein
MSGFDDAFHGILGDPRAAETVKLAESALHRIRRRAQRIAERDGRLKNGIRLQELAAGIAASLRRGDQPAAQQLISAGASLFGANSLVAAVTEQSRQIELDALRAAQERLEPDRLERYPAVEPYDIDDA